MKGWRARRQVPDVKTDSALVAATDEPSAAHNWRVERFRRLYDANYDDLWRYCLRRSANPAAAEDALSETMAVVWRKLDDVPAGAGGRPWLFGIARNQLRNDWRKGRRADALIERVGHQPPVAAGDDPAQLATDDSVRILAALHELKDADQEILRLAAWEELPHREIAELLGCSENAVTIRLHRARDRLTKQLTRDSIRKKRKVPSPTDTLLTEPNQKGGSHE